MTEQFDARVAATGVAEQAQEGVGDRHHSTITDDGH